MYNIPDIGITYILNAWFYCYRIGYYTIPDHKPKQTKCRVRVSDVSLGLSETVGSSSWSTDSIISKEQSTADEENCEEVI